MNNKEVKKRLKNYPFTKPHFIHTTGKVNAINSGIQFLSKDYDIMILVADDIRFTMKGFDLFIQEDLAQYFPLLDGCLHYPDDIKSSGERQITMPVMGKELINYFGYIYHESYQSVFCDNEMLAVVKKLKKYKYIPIYFYQHNHPAFGKGENDNLYKRNESFYQQDSDNYFKRLALNFDL